MRRTFADEIKKYDVQILCADLGYKLWTPDNKVINVGVSEQALLGISIGYALQNKKVCCYSITPFLLYRPFEWIRYIDTHNIPVILAGSGRGKSYEHDGESHWCDDAPQILNCFKNIQQYYPETKEEIPSVLDEIINNNKPCFLSLKR